MIPFVIAALLLALLAALFLVLPLLRPRPANAPAAVTALATVMLLIGASVALYALLGNSASLQRPPSGTAHAQLAALARHVEQHPTDQEGWLQLGASYTSAGEYPLGLRAYERANRLAQGGNAAALAGIGENLILSGDAVQAAQAEEFFNRALKLEPASPKALFYTAVMAYNDGRMQLARDRFAALLALSPPQNLRVMLQRQIDAIDAQLHPRVDAATAIRLHVTLSPELAARIPPNASLFVFVPSPDGGPPLAVKRSAATLPQDVELSAADAMVAGRAVKAGQKVSVVARISASGSPLAQPGDLSGQIEYVAGKSGARPLEIDHQSEGGGAPPPKVDAATAIRLHVTVAPALLARVPANASLFVFVRAPDGGPPLAVKRSAATLPQDVELSAADAMVAGHAVKPGEKVAVVARISASGSPLAQQGDLYGQIDYVAGQSGPSALTIDRRQ
jgi:cytochrome c-type biogenesis protein CcmH